MKKNYHVAGTVGFFIDDQLYLCLEYETMYQRSQIIQDFLDKVKNLIGKGRMKIHYVISVEENTMSKTTHTPSRKPINYDHKIDYVQNNLRKYV